MNRSTNDINGGVNGLEPLLMERWGKLEINGWNNGPNGTTIQDKQIEKRMKAFQDGWRD